MTPAHLRASLASAIQCPPFQCFVPCQVRYIGFLVKRKMAYLYKIIQISKHNISPLASPLPSRNYKLIVGEVVISYWLN